MLKYRKLICLAFGHPTEKAHYQKIEGRTKTDIYNCPRCHKIYSSFTVLLNKKQKTKVTITIEM